MHDVIRIRCAHDLANGKAHAAGDEPARGIAKRASRYDKVHRPVRLRPKLQVCGRARTPMIGRTMW